MSNEPKSDIYIASGFIAGLEVPGTSSPRPLRDLSIFERASSGADVPAEITRLAQELIREENDEAPSEGLVLGSARKITVDDSVGEFFAFLTTTGGVCYLFSDGVGGCIDSLPSGIVLQWAEAAGDDARVPSRVFGIAEDGIVRIEVEFTSGETVRHDILDNGFAFLLPQSATTVVRPVRLQVTYADEKSKEIPVPRTEE